MKVTTDGCLFGAWCADMLSRFQEDAILTNAPKQVLDIGTGTGLLSLMIAQKLLTKIDAVEIEPSAAKQAEENFAASPWSSGLKVIHQDINEFNPTHFYDVIISNPPFYEQELASGKHAKDIAHHSMQLNIRQLFLFVKQNLREDGIFFLLLPFKRLKEAEKLLSENLLYPIHITEVHQSEKHQAFRIMLMGTTNRKDLTVSSIIIKDSTGSYTSEFTRLLKDYYLYL